ncbi:MAG: TIGR00730 family Rossman fold protein, partial [Gemmatimonadaceae bacterium]
TPSLDEAPRAVPESADEEILGADTPVVQSLLDDEARVHRAASELRQGFQLLGHVGKAVTIFGSARTEPSHAEYAQAQELARRLGERGFAIITGGGPGAMEAANRGAQEAGAPSIGLDIELPHEQALNGYVDPDLGLTMHYFFTRKVMFVRYASAFVCFPGGFGTLDELFEALTLIQTGKIYRFPVILFGRYYWAGLLRWLQARVLSEGKISEGDLDLMLVTDDPAEAAQAIITAYKSIGKTGGDQFDEALESARNGKR